MRPSDSVSGLKAVTSVSVWLKSRCTSVLPAVYVPTTSMPWVVVSKSLVKKRKFAMLAALVMPSASRPCTSSGVRAKFWVTARRSRRSTRKRSVVTDTLPPRRMNPAE